jgi:heme/copper-type cytochrome/quinol oxidase subunit 1
MIRLSIYYLVQGFTLGALMLINKGLPIIPWAWQLLSLHIESVLFGWTMQFVMGMAYWILPRFARGETRGKESFFLLAFVLLNIGIWLVGIADLFSISDWLKVAGRVMELSGIIAFASQAWRRVKPLGK